MICELVNDDGTVAKGDQVKRFAARHGLIRISVAELAAFRAAATAGQVPEAAQDKAEDKAGGLARVA